MKTVPPEPSSLNTCFHNFLISLTQKSHTQCLLIPIRFFSLGIGVFWKKISLLKLINLLACSTIYECEEMIIISSFSSLFSDFLIVSVFFISSEEHGFTWGSVHHRSVRALKWKKFPTKQWGSMAITSSLDRPLTRHILLRLCLPFISFLPSCHSENLL